MSAPDFTLDPAVVFLNHGSFGACPRVVQEAQTGWRDRMEQQPVRFFDADLEGALDEVRAALGIFLGARPMDLVPVRNATAAVNAVLRSLDLRPGDELLTTDHAYGACKNALDYVAERAGAQVVVAAVPFPLKDAAEVTDAVLAAVSPRTRLCLLDHITSPTALLLPVEQIVPALELRGVRVLVDGAHGPGQVPLQIAALGPSYYVGNCHKWLFAPKGAGFLYVRDDVQREVRPLSISHGATLDRADRSRLLLEFDWIGTDDPTPWLSIPAALQFGERAIPGGFGGVMAHNHALVVEGRRLVCDALDVEVPVPEALLGSMATIPLPRAAATGWTGPALHDALRDRFNIEVPVPPWPSADALNVRISAQLYNRADQYQALGARLAELLAS